MKAAHRTTVLALILAAPFAQARRSGKNVSPDLANKFAAAKSTTMGIMENAQKNPGSANLVYLPGYLLPADGVPVEVGNEVSGAAGVGGAPGAHLDEQGAMAAREKVNGQMK